MTRTGRSFAGSGSPEREPEFFRTSEDVYATGVMFLAERFHHQLDAEDDLGLIVVDSRFREDDQRLRRFFSDLTKDGTPYMQLPRIVEGLFLGPSHYSIGLQCADLIVAMTANAERGPGQGRRNAPPLHRKSRDEPVKPECRPSDGEDELDRPHRDSYFHAGGVAAPYVRHRTNCVRCKL